MELFQTKVSDQAVFYIFLQKFEHFNVLVFELALVHFLHHLDMLMNLLPVFKWDQVGVIEIVLRERPNFILNFNESTKVLN